MSLGPNTNAAAELLSANVILVCGEDRGYLLPFVGGTRSHAFRCFEFWKLPEYTLILCGMGSGCVEPLMWEILQPKVVRQIILIGTAGKMPDANAQIGQPYAIAESWLAGTSLDGEHIPQPLAPRWPTALDIPIASSVSTDFFYGFAPRILEDDAYPFIYGTLALRYAEHLEMATQLVDMEVAQFYTFCQRFGDTNLNFLAIKGPSNELGADGQQIAETADVITHCLDAAKRLLGISNR